jgi:hypothetical protein
MNVTYVLGVVAAMATLVFVVELLRRGILRERFAVLWLVVGAVLVVLAVFPTILEAAADLVGVAVPSNLLFVAGGFLLLIISVQLSWEVSVADARIRRLAEEVALLRHDVEELRGTGPQ